VRPGIEADLAEWDKHDPLKRMAKWLITHGAASADDLERRRQAEQKMIDDAFKQVVVDVK